MLYLFIDGWIEEKKIGELMRISCECQISVDVLFYRGKSNEVDEKSPIKCNTI